jgi:rRNA maturation protein Nop10
MANTVTCENCGKQRYTWEACHHCGHVHWRHAPDT